MLHDVIVLVHVLILFQKNHKKPFKTNYFPYLFPPEGNFDIDAGDGSGRGPCRTQQSPTNTNNHKKKFVRKLSTLLDIFQKMSNSFFKMSSYIQKITENPINALKITIYTTKHTKHTQIHLTNPNFRFFGNVQESHSFILLHMKISIIHTLYTWHILYISYDAYLVTNIFVFF